jgi:hypothetical protein
MASDVDPTALLMLMPLPEMGTRPRAGFFLDNPYIQCGLILIAVAD